MRSVVKRRKRSEACPSRMEMRREIEYSATGDHRAGMEGPRDRWSVHESVEERSGGGRRGDLPNAY